MGLPVYVIHFMAPSWCAETVESLQRSSIELDITVIDNSGDVYVDVPTIVPRENLGYAGAANLAVSLSAPSPYLVITSHDVLVDPDTLERMLEAIESHPEIGVLSPNVGGAGCIVGVERDIEYRDWVSGTLLLLRRECLEQVGTFDEDFHSYVEDADFGLRANRAGWLVGRLTTAKADERGSSIGRDMARREILANGTLLAFKRSGVWGVLKSARSAVATSLRSFLLGVLPVKQRASHMIIARETAVGMLLGLTRVWRVGRRTWRGGANRGS